MNLNAVQLTNAGAIINAAKAAGINNSAFIAAMLAIASKESALRVISEGSYAGTDNTRIRQIFSKTRQLTDPQLDNLKASPQRFFNFVYGGILGNNTSGDGYRYRGRGFNQLTGKSNYILAAKDTGLPLDTNPDLLNDPQTAARVLVFFYIRNLPAAIRSGKYTITNLTQLKDTSQAYDLAYNINRGKHSFPINDTTGGYKIGKANLPGIFAIVEKKKINFFPIIIVVALASAVYLAAR